MTPLETLTQTLGPQIVKTDQQSLFNSSFDASKIPGTPEALILPTSPSHIQQTLQIANQHLIPITTRGAGSSLTGSASPLSGGWVIDTSLLNSITIDPLHKIAHVGPGAITSNIQNAAKSHNLFYPPDPASSKFCTIGGNIACNAGGLRGLKYGSTRDYILALDAYLPNGNPISTAKPLKKFACAYNLRDLLIGSEGTLAIITCASLKLLPAPQHRWTGMLHFENDSLAVQAALDILQLPILPSAVEFLDSLTTSNQPTLILEFDGSQPAINAELQILETFTQQHNLPAPKSFHQPNSDSIWQYRRQCSSSMFNHASRKLNEDIVVPLNKIHTLLDFIKSLQQKYSLKIPTFGHIGDGNLHVNIMYNDDQKTSASSALEDLMHKVIDLNGAISGEHGIGIAKSPFLKSQIGQTQLSLMQSIKNTFDPNNILNPNKIFTPTPIWNFTPVNSPLPWDKD